MLIPLPSGAYTPLPVCAQVLEAMEAKVAQNMGVAAGNVDITAAAGSVVLSISIGYDDADEATAAATTLSTVMATADDATAMLTTSALTVAATTVTTPVSGAGSVAPSPPRCSQPSFQVSPAAVAEGSTRK